MFFGFIVVVVVVTFELWLVYSVLYSFKFKTKGVGESLQSMHPELSSPVIYNHLWRHNKFNPINIIRTGEEMEMLECKQFQTKQSMKGHTSQVISRKS